MGVFRLNMKILVTGSSGFIGTNLVEHLLNEDHILIGYDLSPASAKFVMNNNFTQIKDDINNCTNHLFKLQDIDCIYHLAASADVRLGYKNTYVDMHNNVLGTYKLLELMRKEDIEKLIFSSSSIVYGNATQVPTPETEPSMKQLSLYASSKMANESYIHAYSNLFGIKPHIFRFANVVGKYETRGVIHDFIQKLYHNPTKLHILGNGKQKKSFFHITDCIKGITEIPNKTSPETFNLGNTDRISIKKIADIVCEELNLNPEYELEDTLEGWPGDTKYCFLDIKKALSTGWKPHYNSEESIRKAIQEIK